MGNGELIEFDDGEEYFCQECQRKILNWNDGTWITPLDEDTGIEFSDEEIVFCKDCNFQ